MPPPGGTITPGTVTLPGTSVPPSYYLETAYYDLFCFFDDFGIPLGFFMPVYNDDGDIDFWLECDEFGIPLSNLEFDPEEPELKDNPATGDWNLTAAVLLILLFMMGTAMFIKKKYLTVK